MACHRPSYQHALSHCSCTSLVHNMKSCPARAQTQVRGSVVIMRAVVSCSYIGIFLSVHLSTYNLDESGTSRIVELFALNVQLRCIVLSWHL